MSLVSGLIDPYDSDSELFLIDMHLREAMQMVGSIPVRAHWRHIGTKLVHIIAGGSSSDLMQSLAFSELSVSLSESKQQLLALEAIVLTEVTFWLESFLISTKQRHLAVRVEGILESVLMATEVEVKLVF